MSYKIEKISSEITNHLSDLVVNYLNNDEFLKPFYQYSPNINSFKQIVEDRKKYKTVDEGQHAGVVKRGGLLLARIPNETREERNSYYAARAQTQQDAVDNDMMKESDPSSPILNPERKSKVTFGGGQRSWLLNFKSNI